MITQPKFFKRSHLAEQESIKSSSLDAWPPIGISHDNPREHVYSKEWGGCRTSSLLERFAMCLGNIIKVLMLWPRAQSSGRFCHLYFPLGGLLTFYFWFVVLLLLEMFLVYMVAGLLWITKKRKRQKMKDKPVYYNPLYKYVIAYKIIYMYYLKKSYDSLNRLCDSKYMWMIFLVDM